MFTHYIKKHKSLLTHFNVLKINVYKDSQWVKWCAVFGVIVHCVSLTEKCKYVFSTYAKLVFNLISVTKHNSWNKIKNDIHQIYTFVICHILWFEGK